ncbi:MAG: PhoD-like phosphatase N-terminal domain-containing protein, partial [Gemmatimonadota bacterium]|nr:PhoD-like phosphatase N-terminal domain-containing protein [Gemmatimonadota bacterium]
MNAKTSLDRWWSMLGRRVDRRGAMRAMADVLGLIALGALPGCASRRRPVRTTLPAYPFVFGVASGDPRADGVVLWTRLAPEALEPAGLIRTSVAVRWEVAADPGFRRLVAAGEGDARPELGHSLHVELGGLNPGSDYWYRFRIGDADSPSGRARTAPSREGPERPFRFAFASCQNYEHGYFTGLGHLAEEGSDLIIHLGD